MAVFYLGKYMQPGQYVGNPDYRGYLNYLSRSGDGRATNLLNFVGNDGVWGAGQSGVPIADVQGLKNYNNQLYSQYNSISQYNSGGGGSGGGSTAPKVNAGFVNQAYDTKIAGLQSILDTLQPQEDKATLLANNQYQNQANALSSQKAIGQRNLGLASEQVQSGKVKGLADLGRQVETMGRSYSNQLGAYGAGDSSAAGLINQALSGQASKNRSDVLSNAGTQQRGIDLQTQDLQTEYDNNLKSLDDWKAQTLNDIATKFLQQRQQIQQQMTNANGDRAQALAQLDAAYVNQAISQLSALEGQYRQNATDLIGRYQSMAAPEKSINPALQQFAVQPISAGKLSQLGSVPSVSAGNQPTAYSQRRPFEQDYGFGI